MNKLINKYIISLIAVLFIVLIRVFEKEIFNDGLITFFKHDYLTQALPNLNIIKTILVDSFRYWLNSFASIVILYSFFKQPKLFKFLSITYTCIFLIIAVIFYLALTQYNEGAYLLLFYIRRFLTQPIMLFILLPALLYQKKEAAKKQPLNNL